MEIKAKIYSLYYKPGKIITKDSLYQPIWCGKALHKVEDGIPGDNTGEEISLKNPYFSELTGIYWIWKNTDHDVIGTCHYRRYYSAAKEPLAYAIKRIFYRLFGLYRKRIGLIYTSDIKLFQDRILDSNTLIEILGKYDAILPMARKFSYTVKEHYRRYHDLEDLILIEEILKEKYPEYLPAFKQVMNGKKLYANNMFVLKRPQFDKFMAWYFDILFTFEARTDMTKYTGYQSRIMGFMGERLLTVWFIHSKLKIKEFPLVYFKKLKKKSKKL
jgi:hypothetical protein